MNEEFEVFTCLNAAACALKVLSSVVLYSSTINTVTVIF